jgi:hypothetical protein
VKWDISADQEQESKLQETITKTEALTKELADSRKTSERRTRIRRLVSLVNVDRS